jgi:TPR repeat protein/uncharacterized RDD family membrane protein YckC
MIAGVAANQNPFPGLRPFREDEERFFFGRESQVDTMVNKLSATCFLAVVGTSGCGKSSLINCGLRPALHRGLMASAGPAWRIAKFRPDVNPIRSLAKALATEGVFYSGYKEDMPIEEIIETYFHRSGQGVVETFRKARLPEGTNLLIVADQFEELFRYGKLGTQDGKDSYTISENAIAFVNLLLEARFKPGCPIYVVITLRSDFLGDCSQFYGLPEAINDGQYLVPRMTRDERRASIAGPVSVGGADISPVLMTRLLNDVGDNPDQLSILQHALNRTWAYWESHGGEGELKLEHYMEIGTMSEALNHHADEAFEQLGTPERAKICEKLFKALTDLGTDPRGIRRPLKLTTLKDIAGTGSEDEVKGVIEVFREPSRSFLMPPASEPLEPENVIDISHESLMRVWERLRRWADDEANSARRYRRLAETAALEKTGKAGLWRDPELQLALDWQEEQAPTAAWANLYGGDFESAIAFLEKSRSERDHKQAEVVFNRRWKSLRLLIILVIAGLFLWGLLGKHFDRWSNTVGWSGLVEKYEAHLTPPQQAGSSPVAREVQRGVEEVRGSNAASALLVIMPFLALSLLSYFAVAHLVKWVFRRLAFAKILQKVALSSSKAVREQKLVEEAQPLEDAAVTLQPTYASFWHRVGAYVLDLGLVVIGFMVASVVFLFGCAIYATKFMESQPRFLFAGVLVIPFVVAWLYQAMMLSSLRQATLGMVALGIFVTDENGNRLNFGRATARHFARVLSYITLGIGFFIQPFTRKRQTLHDLIVRSVVPVRPGKKGVRRWIVVLCVILGLTEASLASGLGLGLIAAGLYALQRRPAALQKAANQGNAMAQNNLGWLYQNGEGVPKDLGKAAELYQKAADQGNAFGQNNLGWLYRNGEGVPKDLGKAAELYQKAADQGNVLGQNNLGWLYQNGEGVPKDLGKAAELYQKAADQGNALGQNNLGWLYQNGEGVPKDLGKAAELYQKAADQGNALAQANLAWLYRSGQGVPKDLKKGAELYQKAADQGNADARTNLAWLYQSGQGVPKDLKEAAELYQKAADQGDASAQANLGWLYENGQGVPKDSKKAAALYQKAADQGNATAQTNLGWLYQSGQGVPKDLAKAGELFRKAADVYQKAADQGNADAQAYLGWLYEGGQGVPKDFGKAAELLRKAAELHQKAADQGDALAQDALGWLYQNGQGVPKDLAKAVELYQKAADQGNAVAQRHLGWLYENGQGVPKDFGKAAELYQKAADQRDIAALGWLYENGQGVPKDLGKAAELYQRAADQGSTFAQNNLGWLYENGQGVPKDLAKAAELYQKAANHGYEPAIANLKRLSGR